MQDLSSLVSTLAQKRQELAHIETELKQAQRHRLENLASEIGFRDTDELIFELAEFASSGLASAIRGGGKALRNNPSRSGGFSANSRKVRAVVNDEIRDKIAAELRAGTRSAADIATMFGVSASLVNQLKRKIGLTKRPR